MQPLRVSVSLLFKQTLFIMKKFNTLLLSVILLLFISTSLSANANTQNPKELGFSMTHVLQDTARISKQEKIKKTRVDRKVGIQAELGYKTIVGGGLFISYYPTPKMAIDAGFGLGAQAFNLGARYRYFLVDGRLTPYVGLGALYRPLSIDNTDAIETPDGEFVEFDLNSNLFVIPQFGLEFRGNSGFIIGFNVGYAALVNKEAYTADKPLSTVDRTFFDFIYGSSFSIGSYIGFYF